MLYRIGPSFHVSYTTRKSSFPLRVEYLEYETKQATASTVSCNGAPLCCYVHTDTPSNKLPLADISVHKVSIRRYCSPVFVSLPSQCQHLPQLRIHIHINNSRSHAQWVSAYARTICVLLSRTNTLCFLSITNICNLTVGLNLETVTKKNRNLIAFLHWALLFCSIFSNYVVKVEERFWLIIGEESSCLSAHFSIPRWDFV